MMRMRPHIATTALSTLLVSALALGAQQPKTRQASTRSAGLIMEVTGTWVASGRPLSIGDSVIIGDTVRAGPRPLDNQHITIMPRGAGSLKAKCERRASQLRCEQVVVAAPKGRVAESVTRVLESAAALLRAHGTERYATLASRGEVVLAEAVLPIKDGQVDLAPLFSTTPSGKYDACIVKFARVADAEPDVEGAQTVPCTWRGSYLWTRGEPLTINLGKTGLYELRVEHQSAWFFVSDGTYRTDYAVFHQMQTDMVAEKLAASMQRTWLRVALVAIAAEHESGK
jgi:hypothetical protein